MKKIDKYRVRACSDINLELPFFEVLDDEDTIIMDISKTDEGEFHILFYDGCSSKIIPLSLLEEIISEAKKLIAAEES